MRFEARKLIVIGGTRGMGGAIAEVATPESAHTVIVGRNAS